MRICPYDARIEIGKYLYIDIEMPRFERLGMVVWEVWHSSGRETATSIRERMRAIMLSMLQ